MFSDIIKYVVEFNELQNCQKFKEFLDFCKEQCNWMFKEGDEMLLESEIWLFVRFEEVCLLDVMQVGVYEFENGGYEVNDSMVNDENEVGDELFLDVFVNKMVLWRFIKVFIDVSYGKVMIVVYGVGDLMGKGFGVSYFCILMKGGFLEQF